MEPTELMEQRNGTNGINGTPTENVIFPSCLKCADLAIFNAGGNPARITFIALIGNTTNPTNNVFTICNDTDTAKAEFNATVDTINLNARQTACCEKSI